MSGNRKARGRRPIIDGAAKVAMLAALREGRRLDEVAASYGVTLQAFYRARRRDPLFAAAWADAHALSAETERNRPSATPLRGTAGLAETVAGTDGEDRIASNNRRLLQRRRMRHVRFDERRKGLFLVHFAWSCDLGAAAASAGVCERTVFNHRRLDPAFAAAFQAALEEGYGRLEAESVCERLEAQQRLRAAIDEAEAKGDPLPLREAGVDFDRTMKLLARWDRKDGSLGSREVRPDLQKHVSFEEAIVFLDRKLRSLGLRTRVPPAEGAE